VLFDFDRTLSPRRMWKWRNTAFKTGRKLRWDAAKEEITGDPDASRLLARAARRPWDLI
jgi:hypothetical protein